MLMRRCVVATLLLAALASLAVEAAPGGEAAPAADAAPAQATPEALAAPAGDASNAAEAVSSSSKSSETTPAPAAPGQAQPGAAATANEPGCKKTGGQPLPSSFRSAVVLVPDLKSTPCSNNNSVANVSDAKPLKDGNVTIATTPIAASPKPGMKFRWDSGAAMRAAAAAELKLQEKKKEAALKKAAADEEQAAFERANQTFAAIKERKLVNTSKTGLVSARDVLSRLNAAMSASLHKKAQEDNEILGGLASLPDMPPDRVARIIMQAPTYSWYMTHEKKFMDSFRADVAAALSLDDDSVIVVRGVKAARAADGSRMAPSQASLNITFTLSEHSDVLDVYNSSSPPQVEFPTLSSEVKPDFNATEASAPTVFLQRCGGRGRYSNETKACRCDGGYTGKQCTVSPCSDHGTYVFDAAKMRGTCECDNGWFPSAATADVIKRCSKHQCNMHGTYDVVAGVCGCDEGWTGPKCSKKVVTPDCDKHGKFSGAFGDGAWHGECTCHSGFISGPGGMTCVKIDPAHHPLCSYNGRMNETVKKTKAKSSTANSSEVNSTTTATVATASAGGQSGVPAPKCICNPGFKGPKCEKSLCSNHGVMDTNMGICVCDTGYLGNSCAKHICNEHGAVRFSLGQTFCKCRKGYSGRTCQSHQCSNHGQPLNENDCACDAGYKGDKCQVGKCSGHGKFKDAVGCVCELGFSGSDCSTGDSDAPPPATPADDGAGTTVPIESDDDALKTPAEKEAIEMMPVDAPDPIKEPKGEEDQGPVGKASTKPGVMKTATEANSFCGDMCAKQAREACTVSETPEVCEADSIVVCMPNCIKSKAPPL